MSLGLLGNKIGMTQIFNEKGEIIPVTVIKAGPCYVTQIKSNENCGYNAIQIGYVETIPKRLTKPCLGHLQKENLPPFRYLKEYKILSEQNLLKEEKKTEKKDSTTLTFSFDYKIHQKLDVSMFEIGQTVTISGLTIGKGNAGNIKQHNFSRGPMGHGSKHHRLQGSLGAGTSPGRVFPGKKMPRRLGMQKRTVFNLEILDIDPKENLLVIKGCVPGKSGNLLTIKR